MSAAGSTMSDAKFSSTTTTAPLDYVVLEPPMQVYLEQLEPLEIRLHALLLACIGLKKADAFDTPLFDSTVHPWSDKKFSSHLTLERKHYQAEIDRRWAFKLTKFSQEPPSLQNPRPRPNGWSAAKLLQHLLLNPICALQDVDYLASMLQAETVKALGKLQPQPVIAPGSTSSKKKGAKKTTGLNWSGKLPWLRLIHCLVDHDEMRTAYTNRTNLPSNRMHLENRKSIDKRPKNIWELLADKWNDVDFTCSTITMLGPARDDFRYRVVIDHTMVAKYTVATPKMCKDKFQVLNRAVKRSHDNWSKSGEGEGAHSGDAADAAMGVASVVAKGTPKGYVEEEVEDDDDEEEETEDESLTQVANEFLPIPNLDLSDKAKYVRPAEAYVLYAWHMWEHYQLLKCSLQRLDSDVAAGQGSVATSAPQITYRTNGGPKSVSGRAADSIGEVSTVANFALAESVSVMAHTHRYVGDMEATDRERDRCDQASRHALEIACRRREQNVTMYSQTTGSIDKLNTEKRQLQRDLVRMEMQLLELDAVEEEHQSKKMKLEAKKVKLEVALWKQLIVDLETESAVKQQLIHAVLEEEHVHTATIMTPPTRTPPNRNRTPDSSVCVVDLTAIQKNLMSSSSEFTVEE
jgi:hypothetical protein